MINQLLALTEKRLERVQLEQSKLKSAILQLQQQRQDIHQRIAILTLQVGVYEKSEELTQMDFWERQRQKAVVLSEIAQCEFQIENINAELSKYHLLKQQMTERTFILRNKCEKFRKYLKQQRRAQWLKLERQQQNEIEELFVHVDNKITAQ
ncbi:hypothetical protein JK188_02420 [Providencia sp. JGM181]|jgi:chromosome segregation ATPase|uniref:hypothetical protein n=1 Tax=unclassified Providencia TaxID=2633465 RepID=UPI001BACD62A|nr:hypothetical protein [Providencia sp. JGM181]MBS0934070.1 hypothetical protein [Providencia sp. JGM172]MBS0998247.1 hypothetical protein [Providencia sp. JGM178]